jgi:hypothetical protein
MSFDGREHSPGRAPREAHPIDCRVSGRFSARFADVLFTGRLTRCRQGEECQSKQTALHPRREAAVPSGSGPGHGKQKCVGSRQSRPDASRPEGGLLPCQQALPLFGYESVSLDERHSYPFGGMAATSPVFSRPPPPRKAEGRPTPPPGVGPVLRRTRAGTHRTAGAKASQAARRIRRRRGQQIRCLLPGENHPAPGDRNLGGRGFLSWPLLACLLSVSGSLYHSHGIWPNGGRTPNEKLPRSRSSARRRWE